MNYKEHALIIYPQAGEAITAIRRPIRERITPRSYESDLAKEKDHEQLLQFDDILKLIGCHYWLRTHSK